MYLWLLKALLSGEGSVLSSKMVKWSIILISYRGAPRNLIIFLFFAYDGMSSRVFTSCLSDEPKQNSPSSVNSSYAQCVKREIIWDTIIMSCSMSEDFSTSQWMWPRGWTHSFFLKCVSNLIYASDQCQFPMVWRRKSLNIILNCLDITLSPEWSIFRQSGCW